MSISSKALDELEARRINIHLVVSDIPLEARLESSGLNLPQYKGMIKDEMDLLSAGNYSNLQSNYSNLQGSSYVVPPSVREAMGISSQPQLSEEERRLLQADVNGDGIINIVDLVTVAIKFGQSITPGDVADVNGDGVVNIVDLVIVGTNFGRSVTAPLRSSSLPSSQFLAQQIQVQPQSSGSFLFSSLFSIMSKVVRGIIF